MSDLIDTTEMYLRTVFELEEEGVVPLRARIAERLHQSGPTVSQTVARMERDGLLHVSGDRHLELTDAGRHKATRVMRKHRLAERLLLDVIGLEWELVHEEACRWEHVMSDQVEAKLVAMLEGPLESPYGNPIPGLEELGGPASDATAFRLGVRSLPDALDAIPDAGPVQPSPGGAAEAVPEGRRLTVRRLGERLQMDVDLMRRLAGAGVLPGETVRASRSGSVIVVQGGAATADGGDHSLRLPGEVARHVFVQLV